MCTYAYIYIYIYMFREREGERDLAHGRSAGRPAGFLDNGTRRHVGKHACEYNLCMCSNDGNKRQYQ